MTNTLTFAVAGLPAPQGSKSHVGNGVLVESATGLPVWRHTVAWSARAAMNRQRLRTFTGAVHVHCDFVMKRPKRCPLPTPPCITRPDLDKLERACWDALTIGAAIADDSLVTRSSASKRTAEPGEPTGVTITVEELA